MAHLLSNVAFDSGISAKMAHQLTKAAEALTYRQLCIMKLTTEKDQFALRAGLRNPHGHAGHHWADGRHPHPARVPRIPANARTKVVVAGGFDAIPQSRVSAGRRDARRVRAAFER